jgi:RNA polymerase sigma-70 factor (ECF subfamily)
MIHNKSAVSLAHLYEDMHHQLYLMALSALRDHTRAEDAVHDAFHIALVKYDQLCESDNPRGYMVRTLQNVLKNTARSIAAQNRMFIEAQAAEISLSETGAYDDYSEIFYADILRQKEFEILRMLYIEDLSITEIAAHDGLSVEACKKRVQRARENFKAKIQKS